jgi:hypothetical protein
VFRNRRPSSVYDVRASSARGGFAEHLLKYATPGGESGFFFAAPGTGREAHVTRRRGLNVQSAASRSDLSDGVRGSVSRRFASGRNILRAVHFQDVLRLLHPIRVVAMDGNQNVPTYCRRRLRGVRRGACGAGEVTARSARVVTVSPAEWNRHRQKAQKKSSDVDDVPRAPSGDHLQLFADIIQLHNASEVPARCLRGAEECSKVKAELLEDPENKAASGRFNRKDA